MAPVATLPARAAADPVEAALVASQSTFRSPRMFDADDTERGARCRALEARQVAVDHGR